MDVNSKYVIGDKEIGSGHYGVVRTCTSRGERRMGLGLPWCELSYPVQSHRRKCRSDSNVYVPFMCKMPLYMRVRPRLQLRVEVSLRVCV